MLYSGQMSGRTKFLITINNQYGYIEHRTDLEGISYKTLQQRKNTNLLFMVKIYLKWRLNTAQDLKLEFTFLFPPRTLSMRQISQSWPVFTPGHNLFCHLERKTWTVEAELSLAPFQKIPLNTRNMWILFSCFFKKKYFLALCYET